MTKREQLWTIELGQHQLSSLRHDAPMTEFRSLSETDVDIKGNGILATFTQNRPFPANATALTPNGGHHYLLTVPDNLTVRSRIDHDQGMDILGQGSLAVVEPSTIAGKEYVWLRPPSQIAAAPSWLLEDLNGQDWWPRAGLGARGAARRPETRGNGHRGFLGQRKTIGGHARGLRSSASPSWPTPCDGSRSPDPARETTSFTDWSAA
jgi:hypothetical protein